MKRKQLVRLAAMSAVITVLLVEAAVAGIEVVGSGASFPHQIYSLWFMLLGRSDNGIQVTYHAKGSGEGIKDFQLHAVDFAASDAAMDDREIAEVKEGVQLLPMTAGEVVLAYNLPGIKDLKLPRSVYPKIFLGKIKKWNDPAIAAANPAVELPDLEITVAGRTDSSGTTFVFTKHLSAISEEFNKELGFGKKIKWPEAVKITKAPLNAGIIAVIKKTPGAIGYVDYGFASLVKLDMARLQNKEGEFVAPGLEGGQAALASGELPENMIAWLSDPAGRHSYPITTYTWMMFYKKYEDPAKAEAMRKMVAFCLDEGQRISDRFGYIPLPESVVAMVRAASVNIQ